MSRERKPLFPSYPVSTMWQRFSLWPNCRHVPLSLLFNSVASLDPAFGLPSIVVTGIPLSQFSENPQTLISDNPGLPSVRILLGQYSKTLYPWCLLLAIFHPLTALILLIDYKSTVVCCISLSHSTNLDTYYNSPDKIFLTVLTSVRINLL